MPRRPSSRGNGSDEGSEQTMITNRHRGSLSELPTPPRTHGRFALFKRNRNRRKRKQSCQGSVYGILRSRPQPFSFIALIPHLKNQVNQNAKQSKFTTTLLCKHLEALGLSTPLAEAFIAAMAEQGVLKPATNHSRRAISRHQCPNNVSSPPKRQQAWCWADFATIASPSAAIACTATIIEGRVKGRVSVRLVYPMLVVDHDLISISFPFDSVADVVIAADRFSFSCTQSHLPLHHGTWIVRLTDTPSFLETLQNLLRYKSRIDALDRAMARQEIQCQSPQQNTYDNHASTALHNANDGDTDGGDDTDYLRSSQYVLCLNEERSLTCTSRILADRSKSSSSPSRRELTRNTQHRVAARRLNHARSVDGSCHVLPALQGQRSFSCTTTPRGTPSPHTSHRLFGKSTPPPLPLSPRPLYTMPKQIRESLSQSLPALHHQHQPQPLRDAEASSVPGVLPAPFPTARVDHFPAQPQKQEEPNLPRNRRDSMLGHNGETPLCFKHLYTPSSPTGIRSEMLHGTPSVSSSCAHPKKSASTRTSASLTQDPSQAPMYSEVNKSTLVFPNADGGTAAEQVGARKPANNNCHRQSVLAQDDEGKWCCASVRLSDISCSYDLDDSGDNDDENDDAGEHDEEIGRKESNDWCAGKRKTSNSMAPARDVFDRVDDFMEESSVRSSRRHSSFVSAQYPRTASTSPARSVSPHLFLSQQRACISKPQTPTDTRRGSNPEESRTRRSMDKIRHGSGTSSHPVPKACEQRAHARQRGYSVGSVPPHRTLADDHIYAVIDSRSPVHPAHSNCSRRSSVTTNTTATVYTSTSNVGVPEDGDAFSDWSHRSASRTCLYQEGAEPQEQMHCLRRKGSDLRCAVSTKNALSAKIPDDQRLQLSHCREDQIPQAQPVFSLQIQQSKHNPRSHMHFKMNKESSMPTKDSPLRQVHRKSNEGKPSPLKIGASRDNCCHKDEENWNLLQKQELQELQDQQRQHREQEQNQTLPDADQSKNMTSPLQTNRSVPHPQHAKSGRILPLEVGEQMPRFNFDHEEIASWRNDSSPQEFVSDAQKNGGPTNPAILVTTATATTATATTTLTPPSSPMRLAQALPKMVRPFLRQISSRSLFSKSSTRSAQAAPAPRHSHDLVGRFMHDFPSQSSSRQGSLCSSTDAQNSFDGRSCTQTSLEFQSLRGRQLSYSSNTSRSPSRSHTPPSPLMRRKRYPSKRFGKEDPSQFPREQLLSCNTEGNTVAYTYKASDNGNDNDSISSACLQLSGPHRGRSTVQRRYRPEPPPRPAETSFFIPLGSETSVYANVRHNTPARSERDSDGDTTHHAHSMKRLRAPLQGDGDVFLFDVPQKGTHDTGLDVSALTSQENGKRSALDQRCCNVAGSTQCDSLYAECRVGSTSEGDCVSPSFVHASERLQDGLQDPRETRCGHTMSMMHHDNHHGSAALSPLSCHRVIAGATGPTITSMQPHQRAKHQVLHVFDPELLLSKPPQLLTSFHRVLSNIDEQSDEASMTTGRSQSSLLAHEDELARGGTDDQLVQVNRFGNGVRSYGPCHAGVDVEALSNMISDRVECVQMRHEQDDPLYVSFTCCRSSNNVCTEDPPADVIPNNDCDRESDCSSVSSSSCSSPAHASLLTLV